ncbi:MAG: pseudouridine synthase [Anaerolineaceae bacterium]
MQVLFYNSTKMAPVYVVFNKPYEVLSNFTDEAGRATLGQYIPIPGIYSAGRLDYDSEGLLILTDDGKLIHELTDPDHHLPKTYLVQVEGQVTSDALYQLERGIVYQDRKTRPSQVMQIPDPELSPREKSVTPHGETTWLRLVLREGRKRQIRHMTAAVHLPTLRIYRVAIGNLTLGDLAPGNWRYLEPFEVALLRKLAK